MEEKDIIHLAQLARIELSPDEVSGLKGEIADILDYVGVVSSLTADLSETKICGARYNVFRSDAVTNEPGEYTERLMQAAPQTHEGYVVVKKILSQDDA